MRHLTRLSAVAAPAFVRCGRTWTTVCTDAAAFSLGPDESVGVPPAVSNDPAVRYDGGVETDSITVLLGEGDRVTALSGDALASSTTSASSPQPVAHPGALMAGGQQRSRRLSFAALFDTEKRRKRLLWFQLFITTVLVLLLAGSFATGRDFGEGWWVLVSEACRCVGIAHERLCH